MWKKVLTFLPQWGKIILVRRRQNLLRKEVRNVEEMTSRQTVRLIEWLRAQGFTEAQIVECIEYINK